MYRIREVDGDDEHDTLAELHDKTFRGVAKQVNYGEGFWWLAWLDDLPVAFIGIKQSNQGTHTGYFHRVGVDHRHRGNQLQLRLMRAMHVKARKNGWTSIVTDTRDNPHSANNIIRAGYRIFSPVVPWGYTDAQYWKKDL